MSTGTKAAHDKDMQKQIDEANARGREIVSMGSRQKPTVGRILHYYLNETQIAEIERKRRAGQGGFQRGSTHYTTIPYPLIVVRVMENELGDGVDGVHGQVFLDGDDTFFVASIGEGTGPGKWCWPPRV